MESNKLLVTVFVILWKLTFALKFPRSSSHGKLLNESTKIEMSKNLEWLYLFLLVMKRIPHFYKIINQVCLFKYTKSVTNFLKVQVIIKNDQSKDTFYTYYYTKVLIKYHLLELWFMYLLYRHLTREALPRLDNYRNIMSLQAANRPTLDELHNATLPNKVIHFFIFILNINTNFACRKLAIHIFIFLETKCFPVMLLFINTSN